MSNTITKTLVTVALIFMLGQARAEDCRIIDIDVFGMTCPFCVYGLEKELSRLEGVASVAISLKSRRARIILEADKNLSDEIIRTAVTRAGFTPQKIQRGIACQ